MKHIQGIQIDSSIDILSLYDFVQHRVYGPGWNSKLESCLEGSNERPGTNNKQKYSPRY